MKLIINEKEFRHFTKFSITQKFNAIASTFAFTANRKLFDYYLEFPSCQIFDNNDNLMLTGTFLAPKLKTTNTPQLIEIGGYSLTGILEDCSIPTSSYPLQFDNLSLLEITEKLLKPFNLGLNFEGDLIEDLNKKYIKTSASPGASVKSYLNDLASQRNIFLSNNIFGELLYTRYDPSKFLPKLFLEEGKPGLESVDLNISSQSMHSEITIIKQASEDDPDAGEFTIQNPYIEKYRPTVKIMNSGDNFDIKQAARNALSAELSNIKFTISSTKYVRPGTTIELIAPSIGINKKTELFVEQITTSGTINTSDKFVFTCVLPDVYTNSEVKNVFL